MMTFRVILRVLGCFFFVCAGISASQMGPGISERDVQSINYINGYYLAVAINDPDHPLNEKSKKEKFTESGGRRAEIVFLLAFPFVALAHGLLVAATSVAADAQNATVSTESIIFALSSTFLVTGAITYADYQYKVRKKQAAWARPQRKETNVALSFSYQF